MNWTEEKIAKLVDDLLSGKEEGVEVSINHDGQETSFTVGPGLDRSEVYDGDLSEFDLHKLIDELWEMKLDESRRNFIGWTGPGGARMYDKQMLIAFGKTEEEAEEIVSKRDYPAGMYQIGSHEPMRYLGYPDWANEEE